MIVTYQKDEDENSGGSEDEEDHIKKGPRTNANRFMEIKGNIVLNATILDTNPIIPLMDIAEIEKQVWQAVNSVINTFQAEN